MNVADKSDDSVLVITRLFDAPPARVFDAWLDPSWIGPRGIQAEIKELNAEVGGRYRIFMRGADGTGPVVSGVYREIARPSRLVFTWMWETGHPMGGAGHETLVTLTFRDVGGKTEMTIRHEKFPTKESRDSHNQGWNGSFDKLAERLS